MQFPENIPKIPALIGIVLLVAVAAVGAITLGGFLETPAAPVQQGLSDQEIQKIMDNENTTQSAEPGVIVSDEPATAEEIEAFNKYAANEKAVAEAAYTTDVVYNPVTQPPAQPPIEEPATIVTGGELVSNEATAPSDIPSDSDFEQPQENYDDDLPENDTEDEMPDDIVLPEDDPEYSDEPYDPFADDIFNSDPDSESDSEEWEEGE